MKQILLATDLSSRSDRAFDRALALAREKGAALTIVHVVDDELPSSVADRLRIEAETVLKSRVIAEQQPDDGAIQVKVVFGSGYSSILDEAQACAANLIVMGMHRRSAVSGLFAGTMVERVVRYGNTPVLMVKDRMTGPYRRVLVGVDFSEHSRAAVEFATGFATEADFTLVHAYDLPFRRFASSRSGHSEPTKREREQIDGMLADERREFEASLTRLPIGTRWHMREGAVPSVVADQADAIDADLLVIGTRGRSGLSFMLLGSVAVELLSNPPCDILALKT